MSFSVDDLVASLSGSHIGQEAMDLASLQAQLSQTLFAQQIQTSISGQVIRRDSGDMQPCNTPTSRTRSSSLSFGQMGDMSRAQRSGSSATSRSRSRNNSMVDDTWGDMDEMDEDEQMVEDLVTPSSPISPCISAPSYGYTHSQMQISRQSAYGGYGESPSTSLFTSTDPFYMAQLQASQNPPTTDSIFAQSGRPAPHSPFLQHAYGQTAAY